MRETTSSHISMRQTGPKSNSHNQNPISKSSSSQNEFIDAPLDFSNNETATQKKIQDAKSTTRDGSKTSKIADIKAKTKTAPAKSYKVTDQIHEYNAISQNHSGSITDTYKASRSGYEARLFNMLHAEPSNPETSGSSPDSLKFNQRVRSSSVSSSISHRSGIIGRMFSNRNVSSTQSIGTVNDNGKSKNVKEKYLGFLRFSKKASDKVSDSRDFMPASTTSSIVNMEDSTDGYSVPDPVILLERLSKSSEANIWKSPIITDEIYVVDALFDSDFERAINTIKAISILALNAHGSSASIHHSTSVSRSSMSSNLSFYSATESSRRGTFSGPQSYNHPSVIEREESVEISVKHEPASRASSYTSDITLENHVDSSEQSITNKSHRARAPLLPKKPAPHPVAPGIDSKRNNFLHKFNSCSTLFTVDSTVYNPPSKPEYLDITLRVVSHAIHTHLMRTKNLYQELLSFDVQYNYPVKFAPKVFKSADFLSEKMYPIWKIRRIPDEVLDNPEIMQPPTFEELFQFMKQIFVAADLTAEIAIITLIYLERMMMRTKISLFGLNCFRAVLGALMLASKVWDDQAVWNVDFKSIMPDLNLEDLNALERWWLKNIKFDVHVKRGVFAKYWFEIREVAEKRWGIQLGKNKIIGYVDNKKVEIKHSQSNNNNNKDKEDGNDEVIPELMAPAMMHGEESQRRKSKASVEISLPKPLTEEHIQKLSASTTQTKLRAIFSTTLANEEAELVENTRNAKISDRFRREKLKTFYGNETTNKKEVEHYEWGGMNLRRTKSDFLYTPSVPAASVL